MPHSESSNSSQSATDQLCQRVRQLRTQNRWSLERLATASGVSRSMLSQIERGQANPTLAVTLKIAEAFGVSLSELVGETATRVSSIEVIRADNAEHHYRSDEHCRIRTLSPLDLEKDVEFYEVQLAAGGLLTSAAHFQGTREFLTVEKGRVRIRSGEEEAVLARGDSATYPADVPHAIENVGRGQAIVFLVVIYR